MKHVPICVVSLFFMVASVAVGQDNTASPGSDAADPRAALPATCTSDLDFAQVRDVRASREGDTWSFSVTVEHNDEGWDHYADAWVVVNPETGEVYGERVLLHPHDTEQPFTRHLSGVEIPDDVETVLVAARCSVHGYGGCGVLVSVD